MTTPEPKVEPAPNKNEPRNKLIGRILSACSLFLSIALSFWQVWLMSIVNSLESQGRMNESDPDGCLYGLLFLVTLFLVPALGLVAIILALFGIRLKAQVMAIVALVAALIAFIPLLKLWLSFLGS
jgi:hypothetical protein